MILELIGSRILAPTLGTSIFVWTSLIGIILGAMSLGYYLGGKFADKNPNLKFFSTIILAAGIFVFFIIIAKNSVLGLSSYLGIKNGSIFAAAALFAFPALLLGAVSPYAVRLAMKNVENSGNTVGNLYAVSTLGSIVGTFLAGFLLIPSFGSTNILYGLAVMLFLVSMFVYAAKKEIMQASLMLVVLFSFSAASGAAEKNIFLVDEDSAYNRIRIYDTENKDGKKMRVMSVENFFDSGMLLDFDELAFEYSKYFRLDDVFSGEVKRAVVFGGAAYSTPKDFLSRNKTGRIDVVEIDPRTTELAKKYFNLDTENNRLEIYHEDARIFLNKFENARKNSYDVIYNDAFSSTCSTPFHLTTQEAIEKIYNMLDENGAYIINIISALSGSRSEFFRSEYKTIRQIFENVYVFPVADASESAAEVQNIIIIATKKKFDISEIAKNTGNEEIKKLLSHYWPYEAETDNISALTDDFAPVNFYAMKHCDLF